MVSFAHGICMIHLVVPMHMAYFFRQPKGLQPSSPRSYEPILASREEVLGVRVLKISMQIPFLLALRERRLLRQLEGEALRAIVIISVRE